MTFFNKKEDVIKIELTPHGRNLLRNGELKPAYYAFFDDDIIYESQAGGFSENSTEAKVRILTDTPSLKPQTTITGVESKYYDQATTEDDNILINPIGTNKPSSKKANGWEATAILGEFSSSVSYISSSNSPMYNVPQIECELDFTMSLGRLGEDDYISGDYLTSEVANDDTFLKLEQSELLLYLLEKNGFSYKDSLSVEVFKYDYDEVNFRKISFTSLPNKIENDILLDESEVEGEEFQIIDNENLVANYFRIATDREIPDSDLCRGIKKLKDKNIYLGLDIKCEDIQDGEVNIYQTNVTDDDIEDCE
tara:strand:+ start:235 stop:1161 length:927 start_codon:yes stop_codon:yes gene_type:complete